MKEAPHRVCEQQVGKQQRYLRDWKSKQSEFVTNSAATETLKQAFSQSLR